MRLLSLALLVLVAAPAFAGKTTTLYGPDGRIVGKLRDNGITTQVWDAEGHYKGRARKNIDGSRSLYSRDGDYLGRTTTTGDDREERDGQGEE